MNQRASRVIKSTLCLALLTLSAHAADWRQIASGDQVTLSVDAETVRALDSGLRQAWFMWDFREDQPTPPRTQPPRIYRSSAIQIVFDCATKKLGDTEAIYFSGPATAGDVVDRYTLGDPINVTFKEPQAGSLDEGVLRLVCEAAGKQ